LIGETSKGHVAVTGSEAGIGPAIRMQLKSAGRTVIGVDLPGTGAEIEADLSNVRTNSPKSSSQPIDSSLLRVQADS
jgi:NAD(P)-dependent dehydrogenase (short-subunit alcohol dehydrogenase family)